jgi:hypothetical protein
MKTLLILVLIPFSLCASDSRESLALPLSRTSCTSNSSLTTLFAGTKVGGEKAGPSNQKTPDSVQPVEGNAKTTNVGVTLQGAAQRLLGLLAKVKQGMRPKTTN